MANKKISGLTIEINADTSGVTKGLGDVSEESKKLSNNLKAVDSLLKLDPTNTELLAERQKLLSQNVETTSKKLEMLKAAQEDVNKAFEAGTISDSEYIAFQRELVNTENRLKDLTATEKQADNATDNLGESARQSGDSLFAAAVAAATFIGNLALDVLKSAASALGDFAKSAVETGKSFDTGMSQIAATLGYTVDELHGTDEASREVQASMDLLREKAKEMGAETAFTATEAADGLNILAMSGYDAVTATEMIGDVLNLAAAGGLSLADAAGYISGAVKGFNDETKTAADYADLMAAGATMANTDVRALGEALAGSAATAASYSQNANDVTNSLLRLAEQGKIGSEASTMLARAMSDLYTPTDEAKAQLDALGVSAYNADGSAKEFNSVIDTLKASLAGMTEEEQNAIKNTIFTTNGLNAFNKMTVTSTEKVQEWSAALANSSGSAAGQAETMLDNLEGSLTLLGSAFDGLKTQVYELFSKSLKSTVDEAAGGVIPAIQDIVNGVDGGSEALSESVQNIVDGVIEVASELAPVAEAVLDGLFDALAELFPKMLEIGTDILLKIVNGIISALPSLASGATQIILSLVNGISQALPQLIPAAVKAISTLSGGLSMALPRLLPMAVKAVTTIAKGLSDSLPDIIDSALMLITGLADGLLIALPVLLQRLPVIIGSLVNGLLGSIPEIIQTGITLLTSLVSALPDIINNIVSVLPQIVTAIYQAIMDNLPLIVEAGFDLLTALLDNLPGIIGQLVIAIPTIVAALGQALTEMLPKMGEFGLTLFTQLTERGTDIIRKIVEFVPKIIEKIGVSFSEKFNDLQTMGMDIFDNISSGIQSVLSNAWNWGSDLISNFVDGIWANIQNVVNAATDIGNTIRDYIGFSEPDKGPLSNFHTFAPDMIELFATGIKDNAYLIGQSFTESLAGLETAVNVQGANSAQSVVPAVPSAVPAVSAGVPVFNVSVSVGSIASDYDVNRMTDQMMADISEGLAQLQSRQAALVGR